MNREQLDKIIDAVPNFRSHWNAFLSEWEQEGEPPFYVGMGELAHYVVDAQSRGRTAELVNLFAVLEEVLQNPAPEVKNLIAVGLFEDVQSISTHRDFGPAPFRSLLSPRSLALWDEVDAFARKVAAWNAKQIPKWWQFWRKRHTFDPARALQQVESPELRKIIEAEYRKAGHT